MKESTTRLLGPAKTTLKVAIVDNNNADQELVLRLLESIEEWDVSIALTDNLASAKNLLHREGPFDVMLLDYLLGMDDGLDLLRRCQLELRNTAVIMLTGHGDQRIAVEALKLGARDYIVKEDLDADTLKQSITRALLLQEEQEHLQSVKRAACFDELTGVSRRWHFLEQCQTEIERSRRYGFPLALGLLDLDHFKHVNDTYGHLVGDQVLERVASFLKGDLRQVDVVGRYGGEEFCVLLPQTQQNLAVSIFERQRKGIENIRIVTPDATISITASFGVTVLCDTDVSAMEIIARADISLYRAKALGRNCVVAG